jgi:hypothetical protein
VRSATLRSAVAVLLLSATPALACKCGTGSRDAAISDAAVVFEGRVVSIATRGSAQVTAMQVVRPIKGVSAGETIKVKSQTQSAACGYDFRQAPKTLLVGGQSAGRGAISVRRCTMYNLNNEQ